jgi:serpin B
MKKYIGIVLVGILSLVSSCMPNNGISNMEGESKTPEELLVQSNNTFTFSLYHQLTNEQENLFISPYSIESALAMAYAGARGNTETEMAKALIFTMPQSQLHPAFNELSSALTTPKNPPIEGIFPFEFYNANAIWAADNLSYRQEYIDTLSANYGAGLNLMDFAGAPEPSRLAINRWVSEQTRNRINDLLTPGSVNTLTKLILTNANYFKAKWAYPFSENLKNNFFNLPSDEKISVPFMHLSEELRYAELGEYQAIELPYQGQKFSMLILLPDSNRFSSFEKSLDNGIIEDTISKLQETKIILSMPKFEFTSEYKLGKAMSALGINTAFSPKADFTGICQTDRLWIDQIYHKTFIAVDQYGTEAAAATAVVMVGAVPDGRTPINVVIDRPFIFLIRDSKTNTILYIGRVLNPKS